MKKKLFLILAALFMFVSCDNKHDTVTMFYRTKFSGDDIVIELPDGYFYYSNEKIRIDDDTLKLVLVFKNTNTGMLDDWITKDY